jgi:hypothetical protein
LNARLPALCPALLLALTALPAVALAQTNKFDIYVDGKKVGEETYSLNKAKAGYKLEGRLRFRLNGTDGDFTSEFKYTDSHTFLEGTLTNQNTLLMTSFVPDKAHTELAVAKFQGHAGSNSELVAIGQNLVILPPFDPGAAQEVLSLATTHPTPDAIYNVYLPGSGGAGGGGGGRRGGGGAAVGDDSGASENDGRSHDGKWFRGKDSGGTLDGKPILLHTYMLAYGKTRFLFYADENDTLMLLNVPTLKSTYVRSNFKLNAATSAPSSAATPESRKP